MIRVVKVKAFPSAEQKAAVCYVGRACLGWPKSGWGNPFNGPDAVAQYREAVFARPQLEDWLADLWTACDHGRLPLGCWCQDCTLGDGQPVFCHGQVLATMLAERYVTDRLTGCPT